VPITSDYALKQEGKDQRNCVSSYTKQVRNGNRYIYRVLTPQRATLAITPGPDGAWHRSELKLKANRPPSRSTIDHVEGWLYQHSLSA
jgi:hypothetical protein